MTIQVVPTFNDSFYSQTTALEGVSFLLSFSYSIRENTWYMSIADANGVDVYNGIKLICGNFLLFKCRDPRRPPGDFLVLSATADVSPPGLGDLIAGAGRCTLVYMTSDVLRQIAAGNVADLIAQVQTNTASGQGSTYGQ